MLPLKALTPETRENQLHAKRFQRKRLKNHPKCARIKFENPSPNKKAIILINRNPIKKITTKK